jgi:CBS domain-containing protein
MPTSVKNLLNNKKINKVISVSPETTVYEALGVMEASNVGAVLVMDNEELKGIFSERDYARKGIIHGRKAKSTPMTEVMTTNVFSVNSAMTTTDCMEMMSLKKIRHLPVIDDFKVIGILSVGDIVNQMLVEQKEHIKFLESYIVNG